MASSLVKKLRVQPGSRLLILNAPAGYVETLADLPEGVQVSQEPEGTFDFVQLFVRDSIEYGELGPLALAAVSYDGLLWICYPKRSSKVETDLTRDVLWKLTESTGLRPVSQVSIDPVWSAMRFRPVELVKKKD